MRADPTPTRSAGFVATATTLVAMVAVAASASAMHAPDCRAAVGETQRACAGVTGVRAMAAAAVAMARNVLGGEQHVTSHPALGAPASAVEPIPRVAPIRSIPATMRGPARTGPVLSLLDLPPPIC